MNIQVHSFTHTFAANDRRLTALQDLQFSVPSGQFVALIGPSGCGKSTLLRALAGLLIPEQGELLLAGEPPAARLAAKQIGWLAQNPALLPWKTALENVELAQQINPQSTRQVIPAAELLNMVGLGTFAQAYPYTLSGGMQHRVALARTLAIGASLWLMDEPFASLDELTREALAGEVLRLWEQFKPTVLWVTHSIYEAVRLADRILVLSSQPGRLVADIPIALPRPRLEVSPAVMQLVQQGKNALQRIPNTAGD